MTEDPKVNLFAVTGSSRLPSLRHVRLDADTQKALTVLHEELFHRFFPQDVELVDYSPTFKPKNDQCFCTPYELHSNLRKLLPAPDPAISALSSKSTEVIKGLVFLAEKMLSFQVLDVRHVLDPEKFVLFFKSGAFTKSDHLGIAIQGELDAVYHEGDLYFRKEGKVRRILDLDLIFRESTHAEVAEFLEDFGGVEPSVVDEWADRWVRRKITELRKGGREVNLGELQTLSAECGLTLEIRNQQIVLPSSKREFKLLLKLMNQDILRGTFDRQLWEASGKRSVGP